MEQSFLKRESDVVTQGIGPGLQDAVQNTWTDFQKASKDFESNPIAATGTFLKNHWQDAAVGAAITLANPEGLANAALIAYASRGLWIGTGSAMIAAQNPNADMEKVTGDLRTTVSHEGTAFLSSMPMAMAGGMVGKAGANAIFGKDMGAIDFATGKVSSAEVKANLWNLADTIKLPKLKVLVTDIDGTIGPFSDYFAPAVRDNVTRMSAQHGIPELEIYQKIGAVMDKYRTHDYPWSLEQSGLLQKLNMTPEQFTADVVKPFWDHMDSERDALLKPFNGAPESLDTLRANDVRIIARTDAPYFIALSRLHSMNLVNKIDEFYGLDVPHPAEGALAHPSLLDFGKNRVATLSSAEKPFERTQILPRSDEKPNIGNLDQRLQELGVRKSQVAMFGDSRVKDGGLAQRAGIKFFYAEFGANPRPEFQDVFAKLASGAKGEGANTSLPDTMFAPKKVYPPIYRSAQSYSDILELLHPKRDWHAIGQLASDNALVRPSLKPLAAFSVPTDRHNP